MTRLMSSAGLILAIWLCACQQQQTTCRCAERVLRVSSTTSLDNTGLLKAILPPFEARSGISVQVLAVGTGQALKLARNGDVDAVLVHDRQAEEEFMKAGFGIHHTTIMFNDFVLVGPKSDPAAVRGSDAVAALAGIARASATFVSRGDESGTHRAELRLWQAAGIQPRGDWYLESGRGQRLNLNLADEKSAYCLTDRATFLSAADAIDLVVLVEGDPRLRNPYSFMAVNPVQHPQARLPEALALLGWLQSTQARKMIGDFRVQGRILFHPLAPGQQPPEPAGTGTAKTTAPSP